MSLNRREALLSTAAVLLTSSIAPDAVAARRTSEGSTAAPQPAAAPQTSAAPRSTVAPQVEITSPTDFGFDSLLEKHFPSLKASARFGAIRASAFLVRNVSGQDIHGFDSFWTLQSNKASYKFNLMHFWRPGAVAIGTTGSAKAKVSVKRNAKMSGDAPFLPANSVRLVTPFFVWSPGFYKQHPKVDWTALLNQDQQRVFVAAELASSTSVTLQIKTVVLADNSIQGNRQSMLVHFMRTERNAQHDQAKSTLKMLRKGASSYQIATALETRWSQSQPASQHVRGRRYSVARSREAGHLLAMLNVKSPLFEKRLVTLSKAKKASTGHLHL